MKIALLSAGPSLAAYQGGPHDLRIGVNGAACLHACDWWSAGDDQTIKRHMIDGPHFVIGKPAIFTLSSSIGVMAQGYRDIFDANRWLWWETVRNTHDVPEFGLQYSAIAALPLALHLGATSVDVFGVDMHGDSDIHGQHNRFNDKRWAKEQKDWNLTLAWVRSRGVAVNWPQEMAKCA